MNPKLKDFHVAPSTTVLEVKMESCLLNVSTKDYRYGQLDEDE